MDKETIGQHGLLDLYGISKQLACDEELIAKHLQMAASLAKATVLQSHFHSFGKHKGITGMLMLSESHISIHTWPEHQFAAVDIFMCGDHQINQAIEYLKMVFTPKSFQWRLYERGDLINSKQNNSFFLQHVE